MFIAQSFIKDLLERVDIFETINRRVTLKVKGDNGWACCPFHNEKTSSFSVNRTKQFYHCFGCGEHGNAISFLMKYEGLDFASAVEKLAQENAMQVRYEGKVSRNPELPRLSEIMKKAQDYYSRKLKNNPQALKYIKDRGLTDNTIETFGLGYAPEGWHNLAEIFDKTFSPLLIQTGLQREGNNNRDPYDFFRNRLMFPIRNNRGQTIAFSARTMTGEEPKYINTGETVLFKKGSEVFGLYEAQRYIREKKRAIVVEGQMDVIQLYQAGFKEACAPLGTAIRSEHIEKLLKLCNHIIFSFDGDNAGHKAARRSLELVLPLLGEGQKASFLFLPEGEDPDSYVKNYGAEAFENFLKNAKPLSNYLVDNLSQGLDLKVPEDKSEFLALVAPLLKSVSNPVYRTVLLSNVTKTVGFENERVLAKQLQIPIPEAPKTQNTQNTFWGNRRFGERENRFDPNNLGIKPRRIAPEKKRLIEALLRNFLLFPQLAIEFEKSVTEALSGYTDETSKAILDLLGIIFDEGEDNFSMLDELEKLPEPNDPDFENRMEEIRSVLIALTTQKSSQELYLAEIAKGRELETGFYAAQKESSNVFCKFELDVIIEEKKRLLAKGLNTEEDNRLFSVLNARQNQLKKEIQNTHKEINSLQSH